MKPLLFLGNSLKCLRDLPKEVRQDVGYQLDKVQRGEQPDDFKPMPTIGGGVEEIRIRDETGAYRIIHLARFLEAILYFMSSRKRARRQRRATSILRKSDLLN